MEPLANLVADPLLHHRTLPVREYSSDAIQCDRIRRSREMVERAIWSLGKDEPLIVELGCGAADICGYFAKTSRVIGVDCNDSALDHARVRFPEASFVSADIESFAALRPDVLILCETLEHVNYPQALVKRWLPCSASVVISHPINEPLHSGMSAGDHRWSYNWPDFLAWFPLGGHTMDEAYQFEMGGYKIGLGRGRLKVSGA